MKDFKTLAIIAKKIDLFEKIVKSEDFLLKVDSPCFVWDIFQNVGNGDFNKNEKMAFSGCNSEEDFATIRIFLQKMKVDFYERISIFNKVEK